MILRFAAKSIWRTKRRSLITALSVSFGVWLAIIFVGTREHTYARLIHTSVKMGLGHLAVVPPEYLELPTPSKRISDSETMMSAIQKIDGVDMVLPRIMGNAVLTSAETSTGVAYIGVEPKLDTKKYNIFLEALKEGEMFAEEGSLVGTKLAERLNLKVGGKFVYNATDANGQIISELARVTGIFETGSDDLDAHVAILPNAVLRKAIGFSGTDNSYLAIYINDPDALEDIYEGIKPLVQGPDQTLLRWYESQPDIANFFRMDRAMYFLLMLLVGIIIASGILNTMMMNVMERKREIGTMLAIGCPTRVLFGLMLTEALLMSILGIVIGVVTVAPLYYYLNTHGFDLSKVIDGKVEAGGVVLDLVMRCQIHPTSAMIIFTVLILLTTLAAIYPARKASSTVPIETIRDY